ncbi:hypothetical protein V5O48_014180 [Marasmius crinis-equi]|uniref:Fungal N-terminal domain-containing protein n=1 Tax=Marasmius crinis-equi TaxID=585013 RepID=A0ABR3EY54_9AGAR
MAQRVPKFSQDASMKPINSTSTSLDAKKKENAWGRRESAAADVSIAVLTTLKEVSQAAGGVPHVGIAAAIALQIVTIAQRAKDNRDSFIRLASDACSLVVNIAAVCDELARGSESDKEKEISPSLNLHLETLTETLTQIKAFAQERADKSYWKRLVSSRSDLDRIKEFRERLTQAVDLFGSHAQQIQSHITVRESIARMATRQQSFHEEFKNFPRQASPEPLSPPTKSPPEAESDSNNPFLLPSPTVPTGTTVVNKTTGIITRRRETTLW